MTDEVINFDETDFEKLSEIEKQKDGISFLKIRTVFLKFLRLGLGKA